jgi:hypothetical protein
MKTVRQREQERRDGKLAAIRQKVASGSLVIRQMTAEERKLDRVLPRKRRSSDMA